MAKSVRLSTMRSYPTIVQFQDSVRMQHLEDSIESYFQLADSRRKELEMGIAGKVRLIEEINEDEDEDIVRVNRYRIGDRLGSGQFGTVYKGYSRDKVVALKQIYKKPLNSPFSMSQVMKTMKRYEFISSDLAIMEMNVNKIRWECFIMSRLNHRNVMVLLECLDSSFSDQIWLAQPLASLGELQWSRETKFDLIEQWQVLCHGQLTSVEEFALKVLTDIGYGLQYLELQGIVHRDVKPQNILVDSVNQTLRISDFGCSLLLPQKLPYQDVDLDRFFQDELNKIVGTPLFTAPELCDFEREHTKVKPSEAFKLDTWALGVTVYSILFNNFPFCGDTEFDTYHMICNQPLKTYSTTQNKHWINSYVISQLLSKDPSARPSSTEILNQLNKQLKQESSSINKMKHTLNKWKGLLKKPKYTSPPPPSSSFNTELHSTNTIDSN